MARRIKDRKAVADKILEMVANGLTIRRACAWAGISEVTFRKWRLKDGTLGNALKKAEIEFENEHLKNIRTAGKNSWQASAWILERKFKKRYGKTTYDAKPKEDDADEATVLFRPPTRAEYERMKARTEKPEKAVASLKMKRGKPGGDG